MKGSIVIARCGGGIGAGAKAANAQREGAKGLLLYPDPEDVARQGQNPRNVAPNTRWLPGIVLGDKIICTTFFHPKSL